MTSHTDVAPSGEFFDMQAAVGVSKHMGGFEATHELATLCHVNAACEVLDVGCGVGVGPAYLARTFGCHVVAVDLSPRMIAWAKQRARRERVEHLVELRTADVLALPFPDDRFDIVVCESVLTFVQDKAAAVRECVRVTKPGGYVGLNEGLWHRQPPPELAERVKNALGPSILTEESWRSLWTASGLHDQVVRIRRVDPRAEVRSRIRWIGWPWLLRAWGRTVCLYLKDPTVRKSIKQQLAVPPEVFSFAEYGLLVGRKPESPAGAPGP